MPPTEIKNINFNNVNLNNFDLYCVLKNKRYTLTALDNLYKYNQERNKYKGRNINLSFLKNKFPVYTHLLNLLINDPYVSSEDKIFLNELLNKSKLLN